MRRLFAVWLTFCMMTGILLVPLSALSTGLEGQSAEAVRYAEVATEKGTLNFRSAAKDDAKILDKIPRGTIVRIVEDNGEWTQIQYGKQTGYVMTSFLKEYLEYPYSLITKEDEGEAVLAFKRILHDLDYLKSDDINKRYDNAMEAALTKLQLMNNIALDPETVTPELQALVEWGMITKGKSGYLDTATDKETGLTVSIFCWDSAGMLYEKDKSVKLDISFATQATGGQAPYTITVTKSLSGGGAQSGDVVTSPFSHIWGLDTERVYVYATATDAVGNTVTACAPFRYSMPERYINN